MGELGEGREEDGSSASESHDWFVSVAGSAGSRPKSSLPPTLWSSLNSCVLFCADDGCVFLQELQHRDADVDSKFGRLPSLTMSFLCCFFLRDYGSKRKSGKSPSVLQPPFFFLLVARERAPPEDPRGAFCCMTSLMCLCVPSLVSLCGLFTFLLTVDCSDRNNRLICPEVQGGV